MSLKKLLIASGPVPVATALPGRSAHGSQRPPEPVQCSGGKKVEVIDMSKGWELVGKIWLNKWIKWALENLRASEDR